MTIKRKEVESIPVLQMKGKFYGGTETDQLRDALQNEIREGRYRIVVDMSECSRITSPVIGILAKAQEDCETHAGGIVLCGVGGQPLTVLEMTALLFRFDHCKDVARAVAAILGRPQRVG